MRDRACDALPGSIDAKVALVRSAAGARFSSLELNAWLSVAAIGERTSARIGAVIAATVERFGTAEDDVLGSPVVLIGSPTEVAERLLARRERWGYSYITVQGPVAHEFAPVVAALSGT